MPWKLILTVAMSLGLDKWAKRKAVEVGRKIMQKAGVDAMSVIKAVETDREKLEREDLP